MRVAIIGGGASGIVAAITAARGGHKVSIIEHMDRIGKKILVTGNGKCNLTNVEQGAAFYHGTHPGFAQAILSQCGYSDIVKFFTQLGIYTKNLDGRLYPYSGQASAILEVLRMELSRLDVEILTETEVLHIIPKENEHKFLLTIRHQNKDEKCEFDKVIIATGSKAAKATGSDGSGYKLAKSLGHTVITPVPALVQLKSKHDFFKSISGIRCDAIVKLYIDNQFISAEEGELQLTDYGVSGIPVFQLSGRASRALQEHKTVSIELDFMPDMSFMEDMISFLNRRIEDNPDKEISKFMIGVFHKNLCSLFAKRCGWQSHLKVSMLSDADILKYAEMIKKFKIDIDGTNTYDHAQTCAGGVDTAELTNQLESKLVKGLLFAGEIIDIDGACGGYNLQWAWSTGILAGRILNDQN